MKSIIFILFLAIGGVLGACKNETGNYIITRLWNLRNNATFSTQEVVTTFETGFGPTVSDMNGFLEYVGTAVDSERNFFYNVFASESTADAGQTAAANFVNNGVLAGQIQKVQFFEGLIDFHIVDNDVCTTPSNKNYYLATRLWKFQENATFTQKQVVDEFKTNFGPVIKAQPGFREYGGVIVSEETELTFFFNIFETLAQSQDANSKAAEFVANGTLADQIEKVLFMTVKISFNIETFTPEDVTATSDQKSESDASKLFAFAWSLALLAFFFLSN